ncbi:uncharacterized protein PRCAT00002092001 [Priceomyces carsonii]|uniref:uncharacterized protein n=1 Tax=Priceomyces carsonii TaxID=28549 RepID=UPI002ED7C367|nr:unnamed protein product [Priceomyces carsonii]
MSFYLPNPSLLGILLIVSSHGGPQLIFNYPEILGIDPIHSSDVEGLDSTDEEEDQEDEGLLVDEFKDYNSSVWDADNMKFYTGTKKDLILFLDDLEKRRDFHGKQRDHEQTKSHSKPLDRSHIFGIEADYLYEMLCPPKQMCNSRFEVTIDDKVFLGFPVHTLDDGSWRPSSKRKGEAKKSPFNMFHLVFIMNPPIIEETYRVDEMFHFVISRLSLVLRYEQLKHDYVSDQVKLILNLKEQYKADGDLLPKLLEESSLCKAIYDCYNAISQSKIANLTINGCLRSLQIPIKNEFHSLPELTSPYLPGSYLSTTFNFLGSAYLSDNDSSKSDANNQSSLANDIDDSNNSHQDIIYFALLLLDDPESIIIDIQTDSNSALANFIRMIKPTESLLKLSMRKSALNQNQITSFAFHLIYWRRARIIQPLSTRSVYIVSPMAPITINLFDDIKKFRSDFPTLPSLPHFLKLLSSSSRKPKQFATIIPSKDHRDMYLNALGWLIRYGYVTQLQTFIWLKISKKIKINVEEELENETADRNRLTTTKKIILGTDNTSKNQQKPIAKTDSLNDEEIKKLELSLKFLSGGPNIVLEEEDDTILIDPGRATTLERRWINKIIFDECKLSNELIAIFYKLMKYMNGKNSLELLLLKENISRTELRKLLLAIEDHIVSVRHW